MSAGGKRGAKALTARDWIFGSRPRRLALRFVLEGPQPEQGWTKADIARAAGLSPKGGVDEHVQGLLALRLLTKCDGRYLARTSGLASQLATVLEALEEVPEERVADIVEQQSST